MVQFYKVIENGYIVGIGTNGPDSVPAVTEAEYEELLAVIRNAPSAPDGYAYLLNADTLTWELTELPPEPDDGEAESADYASALNRLGVEV